MVKRWQLEAVEMQTPVGSDTAGQLADYQVFDDRRLFRHNFKIPVAVPCIFARKDTRLGKRQARDWGSQYGDTSMVFDRISGVGPVCCRTEGKGTSGEFSAELAGCPARKPATNIRTN